MLEATRSDRMGQTFSWRECANRRGFGRMRAQTLCVSERACRHVCLFDTWIYVWHGYSFCCMRTNGMTSRNMVLSSNMCFTDKWILALGSSPHIIICDMLYLGQRGAVKADGRFTGGHFSPQHLDFFSAIHLPR